MRLPISMLFLTRTVYHTLTILTRVENLHGFVIAHLKRLNTSLIFSPSTQRELKISFSLFLGQKETMPSLPTRGQSSLVATLAKKSRIISICLTFWFRKHATWLMEIGRASCRGGVRV